MFQSNVIVHLVLYLSQFQAGVSGAEGEGRRSAGAPRQIRAAGPNEAAHVRQAHRLPGTVIYTLVL